MNVYLPTAPEHSKDVYSSSVGFAFFPGLIYVNAKLYWDPCLQSRVASGSYVHTQLLNANLHKNDAIMSQ